jgi:hypothetical protein
MEEKPMRQGQESVLGRLGKALHIRMDDITHEALPRRWVELIHYLDEQERLRSEGPTPETKAHGRHTARKV